MLNKVLLMGRLVADPELRHTQSGVAMTTFRLAVDRDFKDKETGEKKADFFNVVTWRGTAEFVSRYFTKGRMAVVEGRLQVRDYTDRDGNRRYSTDVVAENVYFGDSKRDSESGNSYGSSYGGNQNQYGGNSYGGGGNNYAPAPQAPQAPAAPYQAPAYAPPAGGDQFADFGDDDGELPF